MPVPAPTDKLPLVVTLPVKPLPPVTLVTVPVVLEVPAPINDLTSAAVMPLAKDGTEPFEVIAGADVNVTGVVGTTQLGEVEIIGEAVVNVTGVEGTTQLGTVEAKASADVDVTGLQVTGQVGSVTVIEGEGVLIDITGFLLTASTSDVLVWSDIDDNQTPGWVDVNDSQTSGWVDVDDTQSTNWTEIAA